MCFFPVVQKTADQFHIFVGDTLAAVLFSDTRTDCNAAFHGGKSLQAVVADHREQMEITFGASFVHRFHDSLTETFLQFGCQQ